MKVTKDEFVGILEKTNASEIKVTTYGEAKMNKKENPFFHKEGRSFVPNNEVMKRSVTLYDFGGDYEERVNEALAADGSTNKFKSGSLTWGQWKVLGRVIENNDKLYIRCYVKHDEVSDVTYFIDGKAASAEQIATIQKFTPEKTESAKQANEGLTADKQVIPNAIDFDKLECVEIDGVVYEF